MYPTPTHTTGLSISLSAISFASTCSKQHEGVTKIQIRAIIFKVLTFSLSLTYLLLNVSFAYWPLDFAQIEFSSASTCSRHHEVAKIQARAVAAIIKVLNCSLDLTFFLINISYDYWPLDFAQLTSSESTCLRHHEVAKIQARAAIIKVLFFLVSFNYLFINISYSYWPQGYAQLDFFRKYVLEAS